MASRSLGTLTLDLVAKVGGFVAGMNQAERAANKSLRGIESRAAASAKNIGRSLGAALGLSLSGLATGAIAGINSAIDRMDELRDSSIRLGIGVETLSAFGYAAKQTGTDIDALGKGFKILAKNMADALKEGSAKDSVFDALGVQVADAEGNLKSFEEVIPQIADAFAQLEDGATKAALAQELFGKSGLELIEFLNQGGEGLEAMTERARELGLVIDQDAADAADKFNDTVEELKGSLLGMAYDVAQDLLPQLTELAGWARDWVVDGSNSADVARDIADGFREIAAVARGFSEVIGFLDGVREAINGIQSAMVDGNWLTKARKQFQEQLFGRSGDWDLGGFTNPFENVRSKVSGSGTIVDFSKVQSRFRAPPPPRANMDALNRALSGQTDKGGGSGGGGSRASKERKDALSEEQKQAEQLRDEYDRLNENLAEQVSLYGNTSEAARLRYQFEHEDISKLDAATRSFIEAQREQAIANAERLEQMRAEQDVQEELNRISEQRSEAAAQVLDDIQTERDLVGQSTEYQDTYNKLKYAGVSANSAFGQSIIEANAALHEEARAMADQVEAMDAVREAGSDILVGLVNAAREGTSAWDVLKDAIDSVADRLTRMIADNLMEKALGQTGTGGGGSGGDWLGSLLGMLFGSGGGGGSTAGSGGFTGPRAIGGPALAGGLYRVNEQSRQMGPELLSVGGRDYLLMGAQTGQVHAPKRTHGAAPMGGSLTQIFNYTERPDRRTREQTARDAGRGARNGIGRTG